MRTLVVTVASIILIAFAARADKPRPAPKNESLKKGNHPTSLKLGDPASNASLRLQELPQQAHLCGGSLGSREEQQQSALHHGLSACCRRTTFATAQSWTIPLSFPAANHLPSGLNATAATFTPLW